MKLFKFVFAMVFTSTCMVCAGNVKAQEKRKTFTIHINQVDLSIRAQVLADNGSVKIRPDVELTYSWYSANKIMETKGGYDGRLLHGPYTSFYGNNNLKEKGAFAKGLKTGKWITWYNNGKIMEINYWYKGRKSGRYVLFNEFGDKMVAARFKNDKLNGTFNTFQKDKVVSKKKYKNGQEIIKPEKKEKAKKTKKDKIEKESLTARIKRNMNKIKENADKRKAERMQKKEAKNK